MHTLYIIYNIYIYLLYTIYTYLLYLYTYIYICVCVCLCLCIFLSGKLSLYKEEFEEGWRRKRVIIYTYTVHVCLASKKQNLDSNSRSLTPSHPSRTVLKTPSLLFDINIAHCHGNKHVFLF